MSLINTMLKDLEKRGTRQRDIPYLAIMNSDKKAGFFIYYKKVFFLIILCSIFAIFIFNLTHSKKPALATSIQMIDVVRQSSRPPAVIDQSWIKSASITGITLQVKDNITEVTFLLDHAALYRLVSNEMQNQLSVIIDRSQLQSELPTLNYLNTAIEKITTQPVDGDTRFTLVFVPGATLKYVNLTKNDANAELVVAIEYQPVEHEVQTQHPSTSDQAIKIPAIQDLIAQRYKDALLAAENGQYQLAIQRLTSLLKIDSSFKDARTSLVALLIDQGNSIKAKRLLEEGLNDNPDYVPFIELKARILATEGKSKEALTVLQTATPRIDENPEYHAFVAAMYEQNNNFTLAANIYKQLLAINPNNGNWWFGLGVSLDKLGKNKDAITAYTKSLSEGHLNHESLTYLQNRLQKLQEAIDAQE